MHKHGGDIYTHKNVIDFSANINMLGTPDAIKKAAAQALEVSDKYPDTECRQLRKELSIRENLPEEYILCGNGAADLIFSLVVALRPKKALLPVPSFYEYQQALEIFEECDITYEYLKEENGFELMEDMPDKITDEYDILFLCNPNNPTGKKIPHELLLRIMEKCRECGVLLVLDECFLDMTENPGKNTLKEFVASNRHLFILKAFTKIYAMAGIRLGYGYCSDEKLLKRMKAVTQPWSVSVIAQQAGLAALQENESTQKFLETLQEEKEFLLKELDNLKITYFGHAANYIFLKAHENLYEECLNEGIMIRDCSNYEGLRKGYYRIAVRTRPENIKLIETLKKCI
ncbi:pyridoxal phosphate-dependent aminotransferase [Parasporobacterium paucivorans]|uniref:L-threonine O-3-phosphate decarboxylase n=1 Tax=Parasporobacterium paucivorans DSM 15970 TaxID=1122934 RepID=A0A1M6KIW6_9FIRM|nr:aminotransferase class I/II-fold pyridoxal phosphate-dependent enzyme [Parasporobacterium paucivorans]SHJ58938.1 L-threonine O-3-phosphate decarboxylase [Parasporobacterium paucivorans DSM 15970]